MSTHHKVVESRVLKLCAFKQRQGRERDGERRSDLRQAPAAEFARHQAGDDNRRGLGQARRSQRSPTSDRPKTAMLMRSTTGVNGRIGDKSPVEMARVGEKLKLVAMKAVAAVGEQCSSVTAMAMASRPAQCDAGKLVRRSSDWIARLGEVMSSFAEDLSKSVELYGACQRWFQGGRNSLQRFPNRRRLSAPFQTAKAHAPKPCPPP
jgi:hypothetical protein